MAVDVSRFVTPEQDFAGIYKVTDTLDTQKQRQLAQAEQERKDDEAKRGKTAASMRFFTNYLDPKDRYSGNPYYDPEIYKYLGDALGQAYELAGKGAGEAEILTAISPLVNKANEYQQKASGYSETKKQILAGLKGTKGYNIDKISEYLDKEMFEGKDIRNVDVSKIYDALNNIYQQRGDEITNDEAIDDLVKGLPKSKITTDVVTYNSLGGRQRSKAMVDMPNLFIQEEEDGVSKFVPKYDKATDAGEDIVSDFVNEKGQTVKAPVRLLGEGAFNDIINSNPAVKHRVEALVNKAIQSGKYTDETGKPITLDSPQARNLGRALMYDMLKQKARVESNVLQETKPAQVRNTTNVNIGNLGDRNIGDYDILGKYSGLKGKTLTKDILAPTAGLEAKMITQTLTIVPYGEIDAEDKKIIGDVDPISDGNQEYYIVRENGDWEGEDGQVISRESAARRYMDKAALSEVKRGYLDPIKNKPNPKPKGDNQVKETKTFVFPGGKTKF